MYCKNCGQQLDDSANICPNCGTPTSNKTVYCRNCGKEMNPNATFCENCGAPVTPNNVHTSAPVDPNAKSRLAAGLLGIFLGGLGVHNFYLGFTKKALAQLLISILTLGICALPMQVWGLIEGIFYLIKKDGYTTDAAGIPLTD